MGAQTVAEWQIWGAARTAHVVTATPTKRSGVKTECGLYVGKGISAPFFALDVREPNAVSAVRSYGVQVCPPCRDWARPYSSVPSSGGTS